MLDKWQGTVEIRGIAPDPYGQGPRFKRFSFYDADGEYLFDIQPFAGDGTPMDGAHALCGAVGQWFVLGLGWAEYDEICGRMKGSTIRIDLSGIDLG